MPWELPRLLQIFGVHAVRQRAVAQDAATWTPGAAFTAAGSQAYTLRLADVGVSYDGKTTRVTFDSTLTTGAYTLARVACSQYNGAINGGAVPDEAIGVPSTPSGDFTAAGTTGTIYLQLRDAAPATLSLVAVAGVSFVDQAHASTVVQVPSFDAQTQQAKDAMLKGTSPYWRLAQWLTPSAPMLLSVFVGSGVTIKTVTVAICDAGDGRVAQGLTYTWT